MGFLRTILALSVVFAHSPWNHGFVFVGGRNAVQLFYVISGFLISHVITNNKNYRNPLKFYANRALRIYPVYYAVALATLIAAMLANRKFFALYEHIPLSADLLLIFSNIFIFGQDWVLFSGVHDSHLVFVTDFKNSDFILNTGLIIPPAWTLGLELTFYAMAPFILRSNRTIFILFLASIFVRAALFYFGVGTTDPWSYRFFPAELSMFLFGVFSNKYLLPFWYRVLAAEGPGPREWMPKTATAFLALNIILYFLIPLKENIKTPVLFLVFIIILPLTFIFQNKSELDKKIGELSYPIYIGHILVLSTITTILGHLSFHPSQLSHSLLNASIACIFALALNRLVSDKFDSWRALIRSSR